MFVVSVDATFSAGVMISKQSGWFEKTMSSDNIFTLHVRRTMVAWLYIKIL